MERTVADLLSPQCNSLLYGLRMLPPLIILSAWLIGPSSSLDVLRPAAIIPWSEYQQRMRHRDQQSNFFKEEDEDADNALAEQRLNSILEQEESSVPDMFQSLRRQSPAHSPSSSIDPPSVYSTSAVSKKLTKPTAKTRPSSPIRAQLRSRKIDDPRAFAARASIPRDLDPPHYSPPQQKPPFAMVDARPPPPGAINPIASLGPLKKAPPLYNHNQNRDQRPMSFSTQTFQGASPIVNAPSFPSFSGLPQNSLTAPQYRRIGPAPDLILSNERGNLVNSIFSQSQHGGGGGSPPAAHGVLQGIPHGVPTVPQLPSPQLPPPQIPFPQLPQLPTFNEAFSQNNLFSGLPGALQGNEIQSPVDGIVAGGQRSPLEGLLSHGSALDQFSKIAKNLLGGPSNGGGGGGGGQPNLLEAMTNGLMGLGKQNGVGTATAIDPPVQEARRQETLMEKLFSSAANALNESMKAKERQDKFDALKREEEQKDKEKENTVPVEQKQARMSKDVQSSLKLLEGLPSEQRSLLEEALRSGEIDVDALAPAIKTLVKDDAKEESQAEKVNRLIEWIKANRPAKSAIKPVATADKLPYYGKYCGSFAVQEGQTKRATKPSGAVWAVDNDRFIISNFHFQPASLSENVTFWLGPNSTTLDPVADSFPTANGFYVRPEPVDINVFVVEEVKPIEAKAREGTKPPLVPPTIIKPMSSLLGGVQLKRAKRDAIVHIDKDEMPPVQEKKADDIRLVVAGGAVKVEADQPVSFLTNDSNTLTVPGNGLPPTATSIFSKIVPQGFELRPPLVREESSSERQPLDWFAGFQPLMLRLPKTKRVKEVNWLSLRDHKRQETIASVIMPNGLAFTIPSVAQLRPLTPNGLYNISSGPIKVHDYKTIEIVDFVLKTDGIPLWFMIGTDILPNASGNIVPIYNSSTNSFDCTSLRDYSGETITLRLPAKKDINDVFWLSVFSITHTVSYSHIYLPYNEMVIPPDLSGIPSPECVYTP